ncbi:helix-turn-helix domain-containing protein [Actinokineospora sp.]|uniref:helix-turn-helix domain-containing protein n=1 Tax=Actinokineospora sp. TaxID=1872133 RepID=UPI00403765B8
MLFTPCQAASALQVRESWLRRRAAARQVPCTFLGKHLRFSRTDLEKITADAAQPARPHPIGAGPRRRRHPRRDDMPG